MCLKLPRVPGWKARAVRLERVILTTEDASSSSKEGAHEEGEEGGYMYEEQLRVFKAQLRLATEEGRPVSLHCVGAQVNTRAFH